MRRNPLVIDAVAAVVIVLLVLIIEPGVAMAAILALILLAVCGISYLLSHRSRRARESGVRRAPRSASTRSRRR